jgi:hypothetical protein
MTQLDDAAWLADRLIPWPTAEGTVVVGSIVPTGFEAYARLLHPAHDHEGNAVRWDAVAAMTGRTVHPEMEWERIVVPRAADAPPPRGIEQPEEGNLSASDCAELAARLAAFTEMAQTCWFCLWVGFGDLPAELDELPEVRLPGREYHLFSGPLEAVTSFDYGNYFHSPNLWWPQDRRWCVATEIDLKSTYIGGSEECIVALIDSDFEVMRTRLDARVDYQADLLNAD